MTQADRKSSYLRLPEGSTWPDPSDPNEVQWQMRYGAPSREDIIWAASVVAAYRDLIAATGKRRVEVVRQIKAQLATSAEQ